MELRQAFGKLDDLVIFYVMAEKQINAKTLRFIDESQLRERLFFIADPESRVITELGLLNEDVEPIEEGVAHPATYLVDREGRIRFADVRRDYHFWIDPKTIGEALASID